VRFGGWAATRLSVREFIFERITRKAGAGYAPLKPGRQFLPARLLDLENQRSHRRHTQRALNWKIGSGNRRAGTAMEKMVRTGEPGYRRERPGREQMPFEAKHA